MTHLRGMNSYRDHLETTKAASVGQLLMQCARLWNEQGLAQAEAQSGIAVRMSHTQLFPHISLEGSRPTEIAEKAGISKQAVGKLLKDMESLGLVEHFGDPEDKRALLYRWSEQGRQGLLVGLSVLKAQEQALAVELGAERMAQLQDTLLQLRGLLLKMRVV